MKKFTTFYPLLVVAILLVGTAPKWPSVVELPSVHQASVVLEDGVHGAVTEIVGSLDFRLPR